MKVGVNGWRIHGRRTGVGRYLESVLAHWTPELVGDRVEEINLYTPKPVNRDRVRLPTTVTERVVGPEWRMLLWENLRMASVADDDVILCPSYTRPVLARGRMVVTTHDATLKMYPELANNGAQAFYNGLYGWSARHATLVITNNETVRGDIARCYGVAPSKIRVVELGTDEHIAPMGDDPAVAAAQQRYLGGSEPFFLYVGKLSVRRNVPKLIEAFAELKRQKRVEHKLLVIGLNTPQHDLVGLADRLGVSDHVVHHEYVPDEDLVALYNAAEALVMPTTCDPMSLPVMEAQAVGTAVITTDTPGLRETTGGTAYLMERAELPEMIEAMSRLATDETLRTELAEAGLAHAAGRSWERCAAETFEVLDEAARLPQRRPLRLRRRTLVTPAGSDRKP